VPPVLSKVRVKVLFFGRLREVTGLTEEAVDVPADSTLSDLFDQFAARLPQLAPFRASLVASRNQEFAAWDSRLSADDDIAFLPPVSGG
jgi:molybdopterin converting factor subunit 1